MTLSKPQYDHRKKAGNQGDVVKHVGLLAALDAILREHTGPTFNYADVYSGYAHNPLVRGNEWTRGIGRLLGKREIIRNEHLALYFRWYLSRPQLLGGVYPGSALIAADVCASRTKKVRLLLWDTSKEVIANLRQAFRSQAHAIFHAAAQPNHADLNRADFLLIDPPDGTKQRWVQILRFLENDRLAILVWLPVGVDTTKGPPEPDKQSGRRREVALQMGLSLTQVRWDKGGRTIGCQLVYRLPAPAVTALRAAVGDVAEVMGWRWRPEHCNPSR